MAGGRSGLVMVLRPAGEWSVCPKCEQASRRIHSRYCRRLNDLPWEGIPVRIELRVRRFLCKIETCGRRIFTERLPKTVQRYGRCTCRLSQALEQITLVLGGSAGSRLAQQLGILASGATLLRQLRRPRLAPRTVQVADRRHLLHSMREALATSAGKPFIIGSVPAAFRSEGRAATQTWSIRISNTWSNVRTR